MRLELVCFEEVKVSELLCFCAIVLRSLVVSVSESTR